MREDLEKLLWEHRVQVGGKIPYMIEGETIRESFARAKSTFLDELIELIKDHGKDEKS